MWDACEGHTAASSLSTKTSIRAFHAGCCGLKAMSSRGVRWARSRARRGKSPRSLPGSEAGGGSATIAPGFQLPSARRLALCPARPRCTGSPVLCPRAAKGRDRDGARAPGRACLGPDAEHQHPRGLEEPCDWLILSGVGVTRQSALAIGCAAAAGWERLELLLPP